MTVQQPCTRVVRLESNHQPPSCGHVGRITSWGVKHVELLVTVSAVSGAQDEEIVAVKMDRVVERNCRLNNDVNPFTHIRQIQDQVATVCGCGVVRNDSNKGRILVLRVEGRAREVPLQEILTVRPYGYVAGKVLIRRESVKLRHGDKRWQRFVDAFRGVVVRSRRGNCRCIFSSFIPNDTLDVERLSTPRACGLVIRAHPVVAGSLIGLDENHVSLADLDIEDVCLVRDDVSEVHVDDFKLVPIDVELESALDCAIDQAKQVGLTWLELDR